MNDTINLMQSHFSVRKFKAEKVTDEQLRTIINAGRSASNWMNFQSYSVIVVRDKAKKQMFYDLLKQESILSSDVFLVFVGDLNRASQAAKYHQKDFSPQGVDRLLISSVDASLAAQNTLLAAESIGLGGVIIGMIRTQSEEFSKILNLPKYTYPLVAISLGVPDELHPVKPRLPYGSVVFKEQYPDQMNDFIEDFDKIQAEYAKTRQATLWSERLSNYFENAENPSTQKNLIEKKLL